MLEGERAHGKFHDAHAGKFRCEPEGKTDGGMEGWMERQDCHSPPGPRAQTSIPRTRFTQNTAASDLPEKDFSIFTCVTVI